MTKQTHRTIRFRLACLVLACVLPICFIVGFLVYYAYQQNQLAIKRGVLETARALSLVVDRELASMQASATALATSPSLATDDLAAFHRQAQLVLHDYPGGDIVLADATGQQLVNSFVSFGKPLPKRNVPDAVHGVYATGKPVISNLFKGAVTNRPLISIDVPVFHGAQVVYDLALTIPAERLQTVFSQQRIPPEWPSAIIDGNSIVVARNRRSEEFVGTRISPVFIKRLAEASEGSGEFPSKEGIPVVGVFSRSMKTGWTMFVGIPKSIFIATIWQSLKWTVLGIVLLSITAIALALFLAQRIAASITERKRAEEALSESEERLRLFIEYAPVALAMFDCDMRYLYVSRHWANNYNLGSRELRGVSHYDIFPEIGEEWRAAHRRGLAGDFLKAAGDRFERADGSVQWVRWEIRPWHNAQGKVGGIVIFTEDITERKKAEEALLRGEKLASVGRMAATIAHEINNPLEAVTNVLYLAKGTNELPEPARQYLEIADGELKRIAHITRQSLGFYRESNASALTSINAVLESASLRPHIFEPFFTTKGIVGTGLGLWVSKQIVEKHSGSIRMRSSTDGARRGTIVSVVLPVEPATTAATSRQSAGA